MTQDGHDCADCVDPLGDASATHRARIGHWLRTSLHRTFDEAETAATAAARTSFSDQPAAGDRRKLPPRCGARRRVLRRSHDRLGRRRSRRHLAHRGRRRNLASAIVGRHLPAEFACSSSSAPRLGGRRRMPAVYRLDPRRRPAHRRRRQYVDAQFRGLVLPLLTRVKFFDHDRGIAFGEATSRQPSGVFVTQDGGETWQPLPTDRAGGWLAGDFLDAENGAVAGPAGTFATLARRQIVHSPLAIAFAAFLSRDAARRADRRLARRRRRTRADHQRPRPQLAIPARRIARVRQRTLRFPRTRRRRPARVGRRLARHARLSFPRRRPNVASASHRPIRAASRADIRRCRTRLGRRRLRQHPGHRDGGRSWQSQRTGGQRAALLGIFADATDVPLELFAEAGAAEGYITAVEHSARSRRQPIDAVRSTVASESRESNAARRRRGRRYGLAISAAPGDLAHTPADLLAVAQSRERRPGDRANREPSRARTIRMWRPDVVVTHHTKLETSEPLAAILAALMSCKSVNAAADPTQHAELASEVGPRAVAGEKSLRPAAARFARRRNRSPPNRFSPWLGIIARRFRRPGSQLASND